MFWAIDADQSFFELILRITLRLGVHLPKLGVIFIETGCAYTSYLEISQESSLLSILFLFYNASLLEKLRSKNIKTYDFVDDVALLVKENNVKENCEQLTKIHESVCKK